MVETLAVSVAIELDLRMEAAGASELEERTRSDPDFRVPHIDWSRTSDHVLTSEWIEGTPLRDPAALVAAGHDPRRIANLVIRSFLTQALRDGFFHADMHPGNLFVDSEGRLVAVDFGIMGRLDASMRRFMAETLAGFLARDYQRVAQIHYDVSFVPAHHPVETFAQALRAIGEPIFGRSAKEVSMARLLQQLFDTTRRFDMQAQPQLVLLQKTMVVVEGVARGLDPDFDIWEASRPVIEKWMIERMGPEGASARCGGWNRRRLGGRRRTCRSFSRMPRSSRRCWRMAACGCIRSSQCSSPKRRLRARGMCALQSGLPPARSACSRSSRLSRQICRDQPIREMARVARRRSLGIRHVDADRHGVVREIRHVRNAEVHSRAADMLVGQKDRAVSGRCFALNRIQRHDDADISPGRSDACALHGQFLAAIDGRDLRAAIAARRVIDEVSVRDKTLACRGWSSDKHASRERASDQH